MPTTNLDVERELHSAVQDSMDNVILSDSQQQGVVTLADLCSSPGASQSSLPIAVAEPPDDTLEIPKLVCRSIELFSLEEIHKNKSCIPSLIIHSDDIAGPWLIDAREEESFFYYDPNAMELDRAIKKRSISLGRNVGDLGHWKFFMKRAVRVFLEIPGFIDNLQYSFEGNFYIERTDEYLPAEEWVQLPQDVREKIVNSSMERYRSCIDGQHPRAECCHSPSQIRDLYDSGNMLPLVLLLPVRDIDWGFRKPRPVRYLTPQCDPVVPSGSYGKGRHECVNTGGRNDTKNDHDAGNNYGVVNVLDPDRDYREYLEKREKLREQPPSRRVIIVDDPINGQITLRFLSCYDLLLTDSFAEDVGFLYELVKNAQYKGEKISFGSLMVHRFKGTFLSPLSLPVAWMAIPSVSSADTGDNDEGGDGVDEPDEGSDLQPQGE